MNTPLSTEVIETILGERITPGALERLLELPRPDEMGGIVPAADRIAAAIEADETITVVGDYDVDGVCATAILTDGLKQLGARVEIVIPCRFKDGYGLSAKLLERIHTPLVVTVDNGINACEAAALARARGQDLIITDHHLPGAVLPEAYAIVDPKQPECPFGFEELCGASVAWYLLAGVKAALEAPLKMGGYLDWMVLAILADAVPLVGPNRLLAIRGLAALNRSERPFAQALRRFFEKSTFRFDDIAFQIAPRLNAAGRMADAQIAFAFLAAEDEVEAFDRWLQLDSLNTERKGVQDAIVTEALSRHAPHEPAVVLWSEAWHEGVSGIVAARLAEQLQKPAIVFVISGDRAKGSARGVGALDLYGLIAAGSEHLSGFGGHRKAAGLVAPAQNLAGFKAAFLEACAAIEPAGSQALEGVIGTVRPEAMTLDLARRIERYEPFGEGNPKPLFLAENYQVVAARTLGGNNEHLRLTLQAHAGAPVQEAIAFFVARTFEAGERVSFLYGLEVNRFRGQERLQLAVERFI
jgi:single-stranded-DNA-specific exonuclease